MNEFRKASELKPHPQNDTIYGDRASDDLVESVRKIGVLEPLLITYDNRVISGHRRWDAARIAGLDSVPVVVFPSHDELDILEAMIEANRQREKTAEQIGREYKTLKWVYHERDSKQGQRTSSSQDDEVKPSTAAAWALGVGQATAHRAEQVVTAIDDLRDDGRDDEAEALRTTLNNRGARPAYDQARKEHYIEPKKPATTPRVANHITLEQWNDGQRWNGEPAKTTMNRVNENIEWAAWSWNPITGCLHNCAYCYARDIAERFYSWKFQPTYLPERLGQPANTKQINPRWENDTGHVNVFTCSMADLFGKWVPDDWIKSVLAVIRDNPQWRFLLLTKFPIRMAEFEYPDNVWLGTSVDYQWSVERAEKAFVRVKASGFGGVCWLSCEPMMERLTFSSLEMFDWVVMGGASRSKQTPEYRPPFEDIVHLHNQVKASGCMLYQKTNLIPGMSDVQRIREFPC